jgi:hypothetical protein
LDLEDGAAFSIYGAFKVKEMVIENTIASWEKRQPKREESSAARVAAHRAAKKVRATSNAL